MRETEEVRRLVAPEPRGLWIELAPNPGQTMDAALFRKILEQVERPEIVRLEYAGESSQYPRLLGAIDQAHSAGAVTELTAPWASIATERLEALAESGLDRLTVSLQVPDMASASLAEMKRTLAELRRSRVKPSLDFRALRVSPSSEELPPGCRILTCDQNPWETVHILANADVVTCEVRRNAPLGNLARQPLAQIWHGRAYRAFRRQYAASKGVQCRNCPYKVAYRPGPLRSVIDAEGDPRVQLPSGWHSLEGQIIWSRRRSLAILPAKGSKAAVLICGLLPPSVDGRRNVLTISLRGRPVATVVHDGAGLLTFERAFTVSGRGSVLALEFETTAEYRPANGDRRELGFALRSLEVRACRHLSRLRFLPLFAALHLARLLKGVAGRFTRARRDVGPWQPGISVIIPERASPAMLRDCLTNASAAAHRLGEPAEIVVVVNGAPEADYAELRARFPKVVWVHHTAPLGFAAAVSLGLKRARFDGVYLLNSDMMLDPDALVEVAQWRAAHVFAIASQIFFADPNRRREETGWTGFRLQPPDVQIFDVLPEDEQTVRGNLYAGGGASLFRRELLARRLASDPYDPFYWEDVEWGVRAWWEGYEVLFCPRSKAVHRHRATVSRFYPPEEIARIFRRNAVLFELRHDFTGTSPWKAVRANPRRLFGDAAGAVAAGRCSRRSSCRSWRNTRRPTQTSPCAFATGSSTCGRPSPGRTFPVCWLSPRITPCLPSTVGRAGS